jgi:hypothetical protein
MTGTELVLAEDDWRQFEFSSHTFADKVDKNISQIQRIHDNAKDGMGWREIYLRSKPEIPISNHIATTYLASTRRRKFSHYSNSPNSKLRTPNPSQNSNVIYAAEY